MRPGPDSPPTDELASAEATLGVLQQVLHPLSRDELSKPTPCSEYSVAQLTDHLLTSITVLGGAADADVPDRDPDDPVEQQVVAAARAALDAWHHRGLHGNVTIGSNELPAAVAAAILSLEFLVHAWDYATATGRDVPVAESVADYVLGLAYKIITPQGRATVGFDPPVDVDDGAPALDRLIAFTGRHPDA
ncbi:TIGR03086 family metal-binding protein [Mycobacterium talmoniae]|uniref:TIGR03086 family protein n=1 Tax=Mycobacterium talmoniae TaxID=1858794 RepID=A0A1S1NFW6_9MYCO|nr:MULTISPECIES: TIGR03086 family metal-binding protein [Mycobacterium]OHU99789.1 TIGR03086 family protein [Mycobacterium talmoniae]TDH48681.1 TIGR03086 family protein [Mycobacterium eburneum]